MGSIVNSSTDNNFDLYYESKQDDDDEKQILQIATVLGSLGFLGLAYILNNQVFNGNNIGMGEGRIYNNIRIGAVRLDPIYEDLAEKPDYFSRQYRTHNVAYPDILYENLPQKQQPETIMVNLPIPPSDQFEFDYAQPSNVITDNIMYEQGVPLIREDEELNVIKPVGIETGGIDEGARNTFITTEYNTGINPRLRADNPIIVKEVGVTPSGRKVKKLERLKPWPKRSRKKFNIDYDERGRETDKKPIYDNVDFLNDLSLTNEEFGYDQSEPYAKVSYDTLEVFEDFLTRGRLRKGYEVLPTDDF